jgi:hypothetical protein
MLTTRAAVQKLHVELRKLVGLEDRRIAQVTLRASLDEVPHLEALDGFVLRDAARAVDAPHCRGVTTPLLVAATIPPLLGHGLHKKASLHQHACKQGCTQPEPCRTQATEP